MLHYLANPVFQGFKILVQICNIRAYNTTSEFREYMIRKINVFYSNVPVRSVLFLVCSTAFFFYIIYL